MSHSRWHAAIGGEVIAILSKGLYANPLDCIREYAQNGVEAGATTMTIKISGSTAALPTGEDQKGGRSFLPVRLNPSHHRAVTQHLRQRDVSTPDRNDAASYGMIV
jgi:hypothetical protein